jgi:hypothetical protein
MEVTHTKQRRAQKTSYLSLIFDFDAYFDEFGLIIYGRSAEWDEALRSALYRRKNRRFSAYWTVRENGK